MSFRHAPAPTAPLFSRSMRASARATSLTRSSTLRANSRTSLRVGRMRASSCRYSDIAAGDGPAGGFAPAGEGAGGVADLRERWGHRPGAPAPPRDRAWRSAGDPGIAPAISVSPRHADRPVAHRRLRIAAQQASERERTAADAGVRRRAVGERHVDALAGDLAAAGRRVCHPRSARACGPREARDGLRGGGLPDSPIQEQLERTEQEFSQHAQ